MAGPEPLASARKATTSILVTQLTITLLAATLTLVFVDGKAAYSAGIGGGISIIATLYFARQVFGLGVGTPAAVIAQRFYLAEMIKIVLTATLFVGAIVWLPVSFPPLILTYMATLLAYWLVLLVPATTSVKTS